MLIILKLSKDNYLEGNVTLPLNKTDAKRVIANESFNYELCKAKLNMLSAEEKEGGFIPILPAIGALLGLGTLLTGGAKLIIDKKT
jgi:hypothetical protein